MSTPLDRASLDLARLAGEWIGANRLWLSPAEAPRESPATARIAPVANGRFVRLDYTWVYEEKPQEGSFLLGGQAVVSAAWVDSWHMSDKLMFCTGARTAGGALTFRGSYSAPPGPDWGWRTVFESEDGRSLRMLMFNVSPDGKEDLAVEAVYARKK